MAAEKAKEFLLALKEKGVDEAWAAKAAEAKTEEEKFALAAEMAKEMGYDLTAEDVKEAFNTLAQEDKDLVPLEDAEVEGVAGGADDGPENSIYTWCGFCLGTSDFIYTGESRVSSYWPFVREYAYKCTSCGHIYWVS